MPFLQLPAGPVQYPLADGNDAAALLGERNEDIGWNELAARVRPAAQGFGSGDALAAIIDLRLGDQMNVASFDGLGQVLLQFATLAHLAVDAGNVELVAVARTALRQRHGLLGFLQQLLRAVAVFGVERDADGGA